jgi:hypothetical protein
VCDWFFCRSVYRLINNSSFLYQNMYLNQSKGDKLWNTSLPLTFRYQNLYQNQSKGDNSWNTKVKSPSYDATLTKWHSSYQDRLKMNWDSITLTNLSLFRSLVYTAPICKAGYTLVHNVLSLSTDQLPV